VNDGKKLKPNKRLKELRENSGLSQPRLAEILGTQQSTISFAENGQRELSDELKAKSCEYFGVSVEWLFFEDRYLEMQ
jgi:Predicted transcriptional regulators